MRFNEITEANILSRAKSQANRAVSNLRNRFSKPQGTPSQDYNPQVEPTMGPQGGTTGSTGGGFMTGLAKGLGAQEVATSIDANRRASAPAPVTPPTPAATTGSNQGNFPFPSSVPPQDAEMGYAPPPVNEPEPEEQAPTTGSTGANAFGQMTQQLNVMPKTSTGGTLANTPTGITHTASPNNPNQPRQNTKLARKKSKYAKIPAAESTDIAEALWRKMKSKR